MDIRLISYPVVLDERGPTVVRYGVAAISVSFLFGQHDVIQSLPLGALDRQHVDTQVAPLLDVRS